jgi:hypothetical protein
VRFLLTAAFLAASLAPKSDATRAAEERKSAVAQVKSNCAPQRQAVRQRIGPSDCAGVLSPQGLP